MSAGRPSGSFPTREAPISRVGEPWGIFGLGRVFIHPRAGGPVITDVVPIKLPFVVYSVLWCQPDTIWRVKL